MRKPIATSGDLVICDDGSIWKLVERKTTNIDGKWQSTNRWYEWVRMPNIPSHEDGQEEQ